jgi:hypothetical protein
MGTYNEREHIWPGGVVGYHVSLTFNVPKRSWDRTPAWSILFAVLGVVIDAKTNYFLSGAVTSAFIVF